MTGKLFKIYICKEKGRPRDDVQSVILEKDFGLVGDCYSGSGDRNRQLTILLLKDRKNIEENYKDKGICSIRFHENILIDGINLEELSIGSRLKIGKTIIEITSLGKRCFAECDLVKEQNICPLKKGAIFAKIIQGGEIIVEDIVRLSTD